MARIRQVRNDPASLLAKEAQMAPIVVSIEISRSPDDVFAYVTDPTRLPEWQASVTSAESSDTPVRVGTTARVTRRVGKREVTQMAEIADLAPPTRWAVRGLDGPVRGNVNGTIDPLDNGTRSRVTIELDIQGHGIGKVLVPLFVKRNAASEMARNMQALKDQLERTA
jgi:uncharacterized protein YndB with AHSA1/START domain